MSYKFINCLIASGLDRDGHGNAPTYENLYDFRITFVFGPAKSLTIPFGAVAAAVHNDDAKPYQTKSLSSFQIF